MESHSVDDLLQDAQVVSGATGDFIFHAGDECGSFLILLEGSVRVQLTALSGREFTLYRIEPGGTCVLTTSCMFSHQQFPAGAVAETPIKELAVELGTAREVISRHLKRFEEQGWIGLVPLVTGFAGTCPVYSLLGIRTCQIDS